MPMEAIHIEEKVEGMNKVELIRVLNLNPMNPSETIYRMEPAEDRFYDRFTSLHESFEISEAREVRDILQNQLQDTTVIIQGDDAPGVDPEHPVYVVGIATDQSLIGLRSAVIWT